MTAFPPNNAEAERLEEIVAYLDGELTPEQGAAVEQRLANDEQYRQLLLGVERAWNALDQLPQATGDDKFARTTMEMVVTEARREVEEQTQLLPTLRRRQRGWTWGLALAAAATGWLLYSTLRPDPNDDLVADLPVIERVEIYSQFRELDFLRVLHDQVGDLLAPPATGGPPQPLRASELRELGTEGQRRAYLDQLPAEHQASLRAKHNRFRSLPAQQQQRLRELHRELDAAPDAPVLAETLHQYQLWLASVPPARQFELRAMEANARVETIRRWAAEMQEEAAFKLTDEQLLAFAEAVFKPMPQALRKVAERLASENRPRPPRTRFEGDPSRGFLLEVLSGDEQGPGAEFYRRILEALPHDTAKAFELLPPERRVERFQTWMRQTNAQRGEVSQQELERFFAEDLDAGVREQLLSLSPGEMEAALKRLYRGQSASTWGGWGRFSRGRDRPPGPREERPFLQPPPGNAFRGGPPPPDRGP